MIVLGIDPGKQTGLAYYEEGELQTLFSRPSDDLLSPAYWSNVDLVVIEDSRLTKRIFSGGGASGRAIAKIARDIGAIDAQCAAIVAHCEKLGIPCRSISPKGKGKKLNAAQFKALTGWEARTNQHCRDAAMVAWPFRSAASA